ncbi:hypothetical protein BGZ94_006575 [Podila epigama]|nr:hypothetical protein BGZ94_006575 [Podila epigama]
MEKRTLRSSTRAAAAAAAAAASGNRGNSGPHEDKNTDQSSVPAEGTQAAGSGAKFKGHYQPNPIAKSAKEGVNRRVNEDAKLRKQHDKSELGKEQIDTLDGELQARTPIHAFSGNSEKLSSGLKTLSNYLTKYPDSKQLQTLVSKPSFLTVLEATLTGTDSDKQLLAASVVTNMAAGGSVELCEAALNLAPTLIGFLDSQNLALVDQAAWAVGNIAAEGTKFRDRLKDNGVLPHLIKLLDSKDLNLVQTSCFALSNLARGEGANHDEIVKAGVVRPLLHHLRVDTEPSVIAEAAWVVVYLTSGPDNVSTHLLEHRLIPLLVAPLKDFLDQKALAIPLIRALGNIASGPDNNTSSLIHEPGFLSSMLQFIQSDCRPVKKESLWLMSNITADHQSSDLIKVIEAGFIPVLSQIATHENFDIRKEARFLDFLRTKDHELIQLGLRYVQLLLTAIPEGPALLSELDGVDALEAVILSDDRDQHRLASLLMDTYFGENNNGSRVPTPIPGTPDPHSSSTDAVPPQYLKRASMSAM